jgi:N-acetylneuraminic acid mutarotase
VTAVLLLCTFSLLACQPTGAASAVIPTPTPSPTATPTPSPTPTPTPPTDLTHGKWSEGAKMEVARSETAAAVLDGLIYVPGGLPGPSSVMEAYDPVANSWHKVANMPGGRHHLMTTAYNGKVYVFGGTNISGSTWIPVNTSWAYDPTTNKWSTLAPMPESRLAGAAVTMDNYIYIVGGVGGTQDLLRYDPQANTWKKLAAMHVAREHVPAAVLDGKIYAIGGRWQGGGEWTSVEVYDPATNKWTFAASLHIAHAGCSATVLYGQIVVAGGEYFSSFPPQALKIVEVYNPATKTWHEATPMPHGVHGNPVASVGGKVYVLGGSDVPGNIVNAGRVMIYTVS